MLWFMGCKESDMAEQLNETELIVSLDLSLFLVSDEISDEIDI